MRRKMAIFPIVHSNYNFHRINNIKSLIFTIIPQKSSYMYLSHNTINHATYYSTSTRVLGFRNSSEYLQYSNSFDTRLFATRGITSTHTICTHTAHTICTGTICTISTCTHYPHHMYPHHTYTYVPTPLHSEGPNENFVKNLHI